MVSPTMLTRSLSWIFPRLRSRGGWGAGSPTNGVGGPRSPQNWEATVGEHTVCASGPTIRHLTS
jgi:hypothetical protein